MKQLLAQHDVAVEAIKAAPPVAVSAVITTGAADIDFWIKGLTVLYLVLQIAWIVVKIRNRNKDDE